MGVTQRCSQLNCPRGRPPATHRWKWPGQATQETCDWCAAWARQIAEVMGFALRIDIIHGDQG